MFRFMTVFLFMSFLSYVNPAYSKIMTDEKGISSYYSNNLHGRKMADGGVLNIYSNYAASRTLPLGSTALVTNLNNGRSQTVLIRDRGPYVRGRIIDLTPSTAENLGFRDKGLATVRVQLIKYPLKKYVH